MTSRPAQSCKIAIIGAGPYGLSVAAHLKQAGLATHVFGEPMSFWRRHMPKGMMLRSPWRATGISDPKKALSLNAYAGERGLDRNALLPLEQFVAYGEWFQAHAVPSVDGRTVRVVDRAKAGFRLGLADGESIDADRVVIATGLANQEYRPPAFRNVPAELVSHSCEHTDFAPFRGKRVGVIGRGQSACESAALLAEAGAEVDLISRGEIHWLGLQATGAAGHKTETWRLRQTFGPPAAVGPFPLSWLAEVPALVRHLPADLRDRFTRRCLSAGAAGWLKPRLGNVKCIAGCTIWGARAVLDGVELDLDIGPRRFDHVLLGTGYRIDLSRLSFLSPQLLERIASVDGSPQLRSGFESSIPKLHFVGSFAVKSFGPLLRFVAGAPFAARAVTNAALAETAADAVATYPKAAARMIGGVTPGLSPPR